MKKWIVTVIMVAALMACSKNIKPDLTVESKADGYLISENGQQVLFYRTQAEKPGGQHPGYERDHYIHPLCDLDGLTITENFPKDHLHHHGIFWAWHQLWVGDSLIGDSWENKGWVWNVQGADVSDCPEGKVLETHVLWESPLWQDGNGEMKPMIRETTFITVHPSTPEYRIIDFDISLLALEENMRIGGADNEKEYSGFSARIRLPEDIQFNGETGLVEPLNTPVKGGAWIDMSGTLTDSKISGLTMMCHPDDPGFPQRWILRKAKSMQNAVWPGREPQPLSTTEPVVLRYRLVIHKGGYDEKLTQELFKNYKNTGSKIKN